ncbi:MAG: hypothetical protein Q9190_002063 [Brigantiaea leucoxantha]
MSLPKTYKAALFKEVNAKLTVEDVELKEPGPGEVLVKVLACGVCHSDANVQNGALGNPFPRTPGHEIIGDVAAVGPGESRWKVGARVGGTWHGGHDGTNLCLTIKPREIDGSLKAPANPAIEDFFKCAKTKRLMEPPVMEANISPGEIVAIQGLGGLGHLAVQYAAKMGFRTVALSSSGAKKQFAQDLGAHEYLDASQVDHAEALQKLGGAAMIVATAPQPSIVGKMIAGLRPGGRLLILALCGEISIDTTPMVVKGLTVTAWPAGHALDCEEAVDFAKLNNVNCMVEKFPLSQANEAFEHMMSGKARFRAVLTMG